METASSVNLSTTSTLDIETANAPAFIIYSFISPIDPILTLSSLRDRPFQRVASAIS